MIFFPQRTTIAYPYVLFSYSHPGMKVNQRFSHLPIFIFFIQCYVAIIMSLKRLFSYHIFYFKRSSLLQLYTFPVKYICSWDMRWPEWNLELQCYLETSLFLNASHSKNAHANLTDDIKHWGHIHWSPLSS